MNIPIGIQNRLLEDSSSGASVLAAWSLLYSLLKNNPQPFCSFSQEYTNHGIEHIGGVLRTADNLITEAARDLLSPEDLSVLMMSVLLHDCAMHLTGDGFVRLIQNEQPPIVPDLDKRTWAAEFDAFYEEAQRWDERKLYRNFGRQNREPNNDELTPSVRIHPGRNSDSEQWTVQYRKFLGEFVRRHHARLAHEIAIASFSGAPFGAVLKLDTIAAPVRDLAGLVGEVTIWHSEPPSIICAGTTEADWCRAAASTRFI